MEKLIKFAIAFLIACLIVIGSGLVFLGCKATRIPDNGLTLIKTTFEGHEYLSVYTYGNSVTHSESCSGFHTDEVARPYTLLDSAAFKARYKGLNFENFKAVNAHRIIWY